MVPGAVIAIEVSVDYTFQASISALCVIFSVCCGMEVGKGERGFVTCGIFEEGLPVSHKCCSKADE